MKARKTVMLVRMLTGTVGGVLLALCFFAALSGTLHLFIGVPRLDAAVTAGLLAFLVWTIAALAAFTSRSATQASAWVFGATVVFGCIGLACSMGGSSLA